MTPWQQYIDTHLPAASTDEERTAAIQGALDLVPQAGYRLLSLPRLVVPFGQWQLAPGSDGVCLRITGQRVVRLDLNGSALLIPPDALCVLMGPGNSAGGSLLVNGTIAGLDAAQRSGAAVRVETGGCVIRGLFVRDMGTGVHVFGQLFPDGSGPDASLTILDDVYAFNVDIGIHLQGWDCNGCRTSSCTVHSARIGLIDEGTLGNLHAGFRAHTCTQHSAKIRSAHGTFVDFFRETDCGPVDCSASPYATWLGGNALNEVTVGDRVGMTWSRIGFRDVLPNGDEVHVSIPHGAAWTAIGIQRMRGASLVEGIRMRWWDLLQKFGFETFESFSQATGAQMPIGWTSKHHAKGFGRPIHSSTHGDPYGEFLPRSERP